RYPDRRRHVARDSPSRGDQARRRPAMGGDRSAVPRAGRDAVWAGAAGSSGARPRGGTMRHRSGLTMLEMLIATGLLAVVGLAAAWVFQSTMKLQHQTATAHDALSRMARL